MVDWPELAPNRPTPDTIRTASSMRSTPTPVTSAVSSAWDQDTGTNEIAPRL
jgi:hypothetical protein